MTGSEQQSECTSQTEPYYSNLASTPFLLR